MEIVENNKLIAEFMEVKLSSKHFIIPELERLTTAPYSYEVETSSLFEADELEYHESWDWLMLVVDKIEKMGYNFSTRLNHDTNEGAIHYSCFAQRDEENKVAFDKIIGGVVSSKTEKIDSVYQAVLTFINWYNLKNK